MEGPAREERLPAPARPRYAMNAGGHPAPARPRVRMPQPLPALALLWSLAAPAADDPLQHHLDAAAAAMEAEARGDHDAALAACRAAIEALPDGPRAPRCRSRVARLLDRRDADGGWTGLRAWDDARQLAGSDPEAARAAVIELLGAERLPAILQAEATTWLAADDLTRRADPQACLTRTELLYAERQRLDDTTRADLVSLRAQALARLGQPERAREVLSEVQVATPAPRPTVVDQELAVQATSRHRQAAWATLALFLLVAVPRLPRVQVGGPPWGLLPLAVVSLGAWATAEQWEHGQGRPALPLAAALSGVHLIAWRAAAGRGRWGAAISCAAAAASLASAWLVLDTLGVTLGWTT